MTRLGFLWARWRRDEPALQRLSDDWAAVDADLTGRSVALVGNARALAATDHGAAIDAHDLVVRLNAGPMAAPGSHGTRTDWLMVSIPVPCSVIAAHDPARVLWMTRKRKRLPWHIAARPGFYLNRLEDWQALAVRLGAPPSTGAMALDLLVRSGAARISLFGFDFFASKSLSGRRDAARVPHDFAAEARLARQIEQADDRLRVMPL